MTMFLQDVLATLAISYLLAAMSTNGEVKQKLFSKVIGSRVVAASMKVVTPVHKHTSVKKACFLECLRTANCEFVCFSQDGLTCYLFRLFVSLHWAGDASGTVFSSCYTSWGRPDNVIRPNMTTTSSSALPTYHAPNMTDGLAVIGSCCRSCFHSYNQSHSYWQVDLGAPVRVKAVSVAIYSYVYFTKVDIRLGNSSEHLSNPVFASVTSTPGYYTMTITGEVFAGRYLALSNQNFNYMISCELQVHQ